MLQHNLLKIILQLAVSIGLFASCYYTHPYPKDHWVTSGGYEIDTVDFRVTHHYGRNYFFETIDTLRIFNTSYFSQVIAQHTEPQSATIAPHEIIAVVDIKVNPNDTAHACWVHIAKDATCQGWIRESELIKRVIPDSPISGFIYYFSIYNIWLILCMVTLAVFLYYIRCRMKKNVPFVHFNDIKSFYPTLLCLVVSLAAVLYGSMQSFAPDTWMEYYYHPTLNPFAPNQPIILRCFLSTIWMILILVIATIDDLLHLPDFSVSITYFAGLAAMCLILYLIFSLTTSLYLAYPLLLGYWIFAFFRHFKTAEPHFYCGECGHPLPKNGICPECDTHNILQ